MKPIDFIVFDGDSEPNTAVIQVAKALKKDLLIVAEDGEYEVLSYYYHNGRMVLEIERKMA